MRNALCVLLLVVALAACGSEAPGAAPAVSALAASTLTPTTATRATAEVKPTKPRSRGFTLKGAKRNAIAFALLSDPSDVTVEGSVPRYQAWSTSKVLIVAALLDTVVDGAPSKLTASQKALINRALSASDGGAVVALRDQIPGSPGAAINRVLRSIGDTHTNAPDTSQGVMEWTIREQVRFMAALNAGKVVSKAASAYLLSSMRPIKAHRWGLGTIGAKRFKGGWLRAGTETRQMGIVGKYAVAIITYGQGPAVVQTDGDSAHVKQMNKIAAYLKKRVTPGRPGTE